MIEHEWIKTIPTIPTFASCANCGKVNNPENIGKECKPLIFNFDGKPAPEGFGGQPLI